MAVPDVLPLSVSNAMCGILSVQVQCSIKYIRHYSVSSIDWTGPVPALPCSWQFTRMHNTLHGTQHLLEYNRPYCCVVYQNLHAAS